MKTNLVTGLIAATTLIGAFSQISPAFAFQWDNTWQQSQILSKTQTKFNDAPFQQFVQQERVAIPNAQQFQLDPAKLRLAYDHTVSVAFINEGAGFRNQLAFQATGTTNKTGLVFQDVSSTESILSNSDGPLKKGDSVSLGKMTAGTQLDFWLRADGWNAQQTIQPTVERYEGDAKAQQQEAATQRQTAITQQQIADDLKQKVDTTQQKLDNLRLDEQSLQTQISQLNSSLAQATTARTTAANAATAAQNAKTAADRALSDAQTRAAQADQAARTAAARAAQTKRSRDITAAQQAQTAKVSADNALASAITQANTANANKQSADNAANLASARLTQVSTDKTNADRSMTTLKANITQTGRDLTSFQSSLTTANRAVTDATNKANSADQKAQAALNSAKTAYDNVNIFGTQTSSNADGLQHVVAYAYGNYILMGFEDLYGEKGATGGKNQASDRDFNDGVFVIDIGAANVQALVKPKQRKVPEPSAVLPLAGLAVFGLSRFRRRKAVEIND
jgi:membrane protein involved in colicin uptake